MYLMNLFPISSSTDQPLIYTLYYMSPEMLLGKTCSTATDMWSLGCMLPELFRGRPLFRGRDNVDQFSCIMKVILLRNNSYHFIV